jgi:hypothetical protein
VNVVPTANVLSVVNILCDGADHYRTMTASHSQAYTTATNTANVHTIQKRKVSLAASAVLLAIAAASGGGSKLAISAAVGALVTAFASYKLSKKEQQFYFQDYVHAKRDVK